MLIERSEDNANPDAQARVDRVRMLGTRLSSATAFVEPEILAIEPQQLRSFIEQESGLNSTNITCKNWSAAVRTCARPKSKKCWPGARSDRRHQHCFQAVQRRRPEVPQRARR
jgi:hypothetical protein